MRHLTPLVSIGLLSSVLACSSSSRDPSETGSQTINNAVASIDRVELNFNIDDGFDDYNNELYTLDVAAGRVEYEHSNGTQASGDATDQQLTDLLTAVREAEWREQTSCLMRAIDGVPYPPRLTVGGGGLEEQYEVSDADCAEGDHSSHGAVISCAAYRQIHNLLLEIVPGGHDPFCQPYW